MELDTLIRMRPNTDVMNDLRNGAEIYDLISFSIFRSLNIINSKEDIVGDLELIFGRQIEMRLNKGWPVSDYRYLPVTRLDIFFGLLPTLFIFSDQRR